MTRWIWQMLGMALVASLWGCASEPPKMGRIPDFPRATQGRAALAGEWEYLEQGNAFQLSLDRQGNGPYNWQDGYFVTTGLEKTLWRGTWHQPGNDREGGFEVKLSSDFSAGEGRWWYTRIGDDTEPLEPGGVFSLRRLPSQAAANKTK